MLGRLREEPVSERDDLRLLRRGLRAHDIVLVCAANLVRKGPHQAAGVEIVANKHRRRKGDPLAMRLLSGTVKPSNGGRTSLVFESDFAPPQLSRPE